MAWIYLTLAGLLEIAWAFGLKASNDSPRYWPKLLAYAVSIGSIYMLDKAMKELPLGTCYVIWTGIGGLGAAVLGILWFGEQATFQRLACMGLILVGIIGLKLTSATKPGGNELSSPADASKNFPHP